MKDERLWKVINTVLNFEVSKGHLKWKVSDIARAAKINRSLIYYYLGSTKEKIFDQCLQQVADEFYGLSDARIHMVRHGRLRECLTQTRRMFQDHPEFMVFYFKWRNRKGIIQDKLMEIEARYRKKLKGIFPHWSDEEITVFHGLIQGAVSSPFLNDELFEKALNLIKQPK